MDIELKKDMLGKICEKAAGLIPKGRVDQWEVYAARGLSNDIDVFNGKVETLSFSDATGIGIRVFKNGSVGYAYTAVLDGDAVQETIKKAIANSQLTKKDRFNFLPTEDDQRYAKNVISQDALFDKEFLDIGIDEKIDMALKLESLTKKADKRIKSANNVNYNDGVSEVCMMNSSGFIGDYSTTVSMAYVSAIARQEDDTSTGDYFGIARNPRKLDIADAASTAARRSIAMLGGKKISSQKMDIILDPVTASQFLELIASALSADSVQKGKSVFKDKTGSKLFGIDVDIYDDGTLPEGLASRPFDAEGVAKGKTPVFEGGILKTFIYDTYTARKDKTLSTGNAVRASYRSTPMVGLSNFYISPGKNDPGELLSIVDKGLLVMDIIGMGAGTNPISGQISVGAKGLMIEKGKTTHAVKEVTIATDILSLMSSFRMLGNDLTFIPGAGYMGSPSILVGNIAVSGK